MRLIKGEKNGCVYASLAMLLGIDISAAYHNFTTWKFEDSKPFEAPFNEYKRVPSMEEICDVAWRHHKVALVPFPFDPVATPAKECKPIHVWPDPEKQFRSQLYFGDGLIEGIMSTGKGHMVAWDSCSDVIRDPRGYSYSFDLAHVFNYNPKRFWLAVNQ